MYVFGVARFLIPCVASGMLAACASNSKQVQFLPWNTSVIAGEPDNPAPLDGSVPTGTAFGERPAVIVPRESNVTPQTPFEYPPYQGERTLSGDVPQG
jgi:hypothetical protein